MSERRDRLEYRDLELDELLSRAEHEQWATLDLSDRGLETLPESLFRLVQLRRLNLSRNLLEALPAEIGKLTALRWLDLSSNEVTELPAAIANLTELRGIDISDNELEALPESLFHCAQLRLLRLNFNPLLELPQTLLQCIELRALDLSYTSINLPDWLSNLPYLQALHIGGIALQQVPEWLCQIERLKRLSLHDNKLSTIPNWHKQWMGLLSLDLSDNQFAILPGWLEQLSRLQSLDLSGNQLTTLPDWLGQLSRLQSLDLSSNQLTTLSDWLGQLSRLQSLDLSNNQLTTLPEELGQLNRLQSLNLSNNQLTTLPEWLGQLNRLQSLSLNDNELTALPEWLCCLNHLQSLRLDNNQLITLPAWLGQLSRLQSLSLWDNQLTMLPEELGQLSRLRSLDLGFNQLTMLPEELGQLSRLRSLNLGFNQLTMLPEELGQLSRLQSLDLNGNQLTTLPEWLREFKHLQWLNLSSNWFKTLPNWLGQLSRLQSLYLSNNQLAVVPTWLRHLNRLQQLNLRNTRLTTVPEWLGHLSRLQSLDLSRNQLTMVPEALRQFSRLQSLDLSGNQLTTVPDGLGQLNRLQSLNLSGNQLRTVPEELGFCSQLTTFHLYSNPLNFALRSAYEAGVDELKAYLQSIDSPERREYLYEAKLVLVGEGDVGKTTLLKALTGQEPRKNEPTTHGVQIDIQALALPHPGDDARTLQFNAWDFGGQEVYRATHQFFFSPRSVYLLLWEPRRGVQQCQVEEWLKLLQLRVGAAARVIIVSTHCKTGGRIARIDKPVLQQQYGEMIVDFLEVDSMVDDPATGEKFGIAELKQQIAAAASGLEQMGMPFNRSWREARDELLALERPLINYSEFVDVCAKYAMRPVAARVLATLMHDLGYIVYYGDDERLKHDVVLQPGWLTKAIGFVLEDKATAERDGLLPDTHLATVWRDHAFAGEPRYDPMLYPFFLRLMEKFDVSYRLESGTASLVAQHVPQVRPPLPWLPDDEPQQSLRRLNAFCQLDEVPPGLLPWMIVRTHDFSVTQAENDGSERRLHWQKGMFLRYGRNGEAMLELRGREFHMAVQALYPKTFLDVLMTTLQTMITETWPGLEGRYTFRVPCQNKVNGTACTGSFSIDALISYYEDGDDTTRCEVCRDKQRIEELLFNIRNDTLEAQISELNERIDKGFADTRQDIAQLSTELSSQFENVITILLRGMANEARNGPRLFTLEPTDGNWHRPFKARYRLRLHCEMDGCQHPVIEHGVGSYDVDVTREWVATVLPYVNFVSSVLRTALPLLGPAIDTTFGAGTLDKSGWKDHLELAKESTDAFLPEFKAQQPEVAGKGGQSDTDRSAIMALHSILREIDPSHQRLGLRRVTLYTGDYRWLCPTHYAHYESKIPDVIE
jgi:internalin A